MAITLKNTLLSVIICLLSFSTFGCSLINPHLTHSKSAFMDFELLINQSVDAKVLVDGKKSIYGLDAKYSKFIMNESIVEAYVFDGISSQDAYGYLHVEQAKINSLYETHSVAYPDFISNKIECANEFLPLVENLSDSYSTKILLSLYANSRFVFGACVPESVTYKVSAFFMHCPDNNKLYHVIFFSDNAPIFSNYKKDMVRSVCPLV